MHKRVVAIPLAALAAAGLAGGAYAATQSGSDPHQAVITDAAHRLHVTPTQLTGAFKQALIDQIDAAMKAGRLTQAQADALKQRIQRSQSVPFGLGLQHRAVPVRRSVVTAAAAYLGLSDQHLRSQLRSGKSLAQIANARGKTVTGLEQAITASVKARLARAVASGRITKAQEQRLVARLATRIDRIVNRTAPPKPAHLPGADRGGMGPGGPLGGGGRPGPGAAGGYA